MDKKGKYNAIIVDDEKKSIDILQYLLEKHCPEIHILSSFSDAHQALKFIEKTPIDLLLLDVQMPDIDGFQLLDQLPVIDFDVVFVTAFDEYALKAFRYYAVDYLLKPVDVDELKGTVARLKSKTSPKYNKADYTQIFQRIVQPQTAIEHLAVPTTLGVEFILFDDIMRLQADSNYTNIIKVDETKVYAAKTLKYFENLLPSTYFFRPHQSHIINIKYMDRFVRQDGGYILMKDRVTIGLARSKRQEFLDRFIS